MRQLRSTSVLSLAGLTAVAALAACSTNVSNSDPSGVPAASEPDGNNPTPAQANGKASDLGLDPRSAFGDDKAPLPDGAVVVSPEDFAKLLGDNPRFLSGKQKADDAAKAQAQAAADDAAINDFLGAHNGQADLAALLAIAPDPADPNVKARPDGDFDATVHLADGTPKTVQTLGARAKRGIVANGIRRWADRGNKEALYTHFYENVAVGRAGFALPTPAQLATVSDADLDTSLTRLVTLGRSGLANQVFNLPGLFPTCNTNVGYGTGGDGSDYTTPTYSDNGLFAKVNWANKGFLTCAKDQGNRGTCAAFAVTSALEMQYARNAGRFVNLSEQHLYAKTKTAWAPSDTADGVWPSQILDGMAASHYVMPLESGWNYNPSPMRQDDLSHSCDGYGETCSNTVHQSHQVCTRFPFLTYCVDTTQDKGPYSSVSYSETEYHLSMSDYADKDFASGMLILMLAIGQRPVVVSFDVGSAFDAIDANGFVKDLTGPSRGSHAVHVVGWVDNTALPQGMTPGDGGGYFVIKNSWGHTWGDGGFAYVPLTWLKLYGLDITAL